MKIVHFLGALNAGGAEVLVKKLALKMSKTDQIQVWVMARGQNELFERELKSIFENNNIIVKFFDKKYKRGYLKFLRDLRREILVERPDVINSHFEELTMYTILANIFIGTNIVQTIHNTKINYPKLQKIMSPFIKKYISISDRVTEILCNDIKIDLQKVETIFNGVDLEEFKSINRNNYKSVEKIVCIGRLEEQKGHEVLIQSYKCIVDEMENKTNIPTLNIYGEGSLKNKLENLITELNMKDYIKLKGITTDIQSVLNQHDIYVMPSLWEGLSISLIEALASEIPILATDVGSNREIIKQNINGRLIKSNDINELKVNLIEMIEDKELRMNLTKYARKSADKFDLNITCGKYLHLYKSIQ